MVEDDHTQHLADRLTAGLAALRAGRPEEAVPALVEVCDDPALAEADDLTDIRARAWSLCAQALQLAGRPSEALPRAEAALALARRIGDPEGVQDVEQLLQTIRTTPGPARREARTGAIPSVGQIQQVKAPGARAELLIRTADAAIDAGDREAGIRSAHLALEAAPGVARVAVLARLCLARAAPELAPTALAEAAECARDAHEPTLLGLVARAAELAGVRLEEQHGPDLVRRRTRR